jgi:hypothetical protein
VEADTVTLPQKSCTARVPTPGVYHSKTPFEVPKTITAFDLFSFILCSDYWLCDRPRCSQLLYRSLSADDYQQELAESDREDTLQRRGEDGSLCNSIPFHHISIYCTVGTRQKFHHYEEIYANSKRSLFSLQFNSGRWL